MTHWLTWVPLTLGAGWANLTVPIIAWIVLSTAALARFAPQLHRAWLVYARALRYITNGGTVAKAALEPVINLSSSILISALCLAAALLAAHNERSSVLPLLVIPLVKFVHAEVSARVHLSLLQALRSSQQ